MERLHTGLTLTLTLTLTVTLDDIQVVDAAYGATATMTYLGVTTPLTDTCFGEQGLNNSLSVPGACFRDKWDPATYPGGSNPDSNADSGRGPLLCLARSFTLILIAALSIAALSGQSTRRRSIKRFRNQGCCEASIAHGLTLTLTLP